MSDDWDLRDLHEEYHSMVLRNRCKGSYARQDFDRVDNDLDLGHLTCPVCGVGYNVPLEPDRERGTLPEH